MGRAVLLQLGSENFDMYQSCASTPVEAYGHLEVVLPR
jgi:hypothetical protein